LRIPDNASRNRHAAQQKLSPAANHAPRASVSQPTALVDANTPSHEFRILTAGKTNGAEVAGRGIPARMAARAGNWLGARLGQSSGRSPVRRPTPRTVRVRACSW